MINDNQRREAARNLRQFLSVSPNKRAWDNDGLQTVGRLVGTSVGENIIMRLADLIDRPTCKNSADPYDGSFFECSECGERWELTCGSPADNNLNFCPRCGAEVVS